MFIFSPTMKEQAEVLVPLQEGKGVPQNHRENVILDLLPVPLVFIFIK